MTAADLELPAGVALHEVLAALRAAEVVFAFAFGSRLPGAHPPPRADSDLDVGAWFGREVASWEVAVPDVVDLLVLDSAPLELAGRVAQWGVLLLDDDPPARVRWQALTRRVYLDEQPRVEQARRDFVAGRREPARGR